jgi:myo-inositol-1(or 4)-monophosphatase
VSSRLLETAVAAARAGGESLVARWRALPQGSVSEKRQNDFVTLADRESEDRIIAVIREMFPEDAFLAEEGGGRDLNVEGRRTWIIDPLDGTSNFIAGFPFWCASIAAAEKGELVATGFPFRSREKIDVYLALFREVFLSARAIRRAGSAALDLANVAAGVFDGFFEFRLSPWDIAAGALLIEEAGGELTDFAGGRRYVERGNVVAGSPGVAEGLRRIASGILREEEI